VEKLGFFVGIFLYLEEEGNTLSGILLGELF